MLKTDLFLEDKFKAALEQCYGLKVQSVHPFPNHAHSFNAKIVTEQGFEFVAKAVHENQKSLFENLFTHLKNIKISNSVKLLFDGKVFQYGPWTVVALEYVRGVSIMPEDFTSEMIDNVLAAYWEFTAGLVDDGAILPERDLLQLKASVIKEAKSLGCRRVLQEVMAMDDSDLVLSTARRRIIHGHLHYGNFKFLNGKVKGFIDLEELRYGTPAEDFVRNIVCRNEHLRLYKRNASVRLLRNFAEFVKRTDITREEWLYAINGYLLVKLQKKLVQPHSPLKDWLLSRRFAYYRKLRTIVKNLKPRERPDGKVVIKIFGSSSISRFVGEKGLVWGGKYFFTSDPSCKDYDWLCIYDEILNNWPELKRGRIRVECPRNRTMLITQEPTSVKFYNGMYVKQFASLLTNRPKEAEKHTGYVEGEGYMVWFTGRSFMAEKQRAVSEKSKVISAIYSSKKMRHTAHCSRFSLLTELKKNIPEFDWFGKGVNPIATNSDALYNYKYTIAAENHIASGHWSEKLSDAIVAGCLPFYAGDPEIEKLLPERSIIRIPIDNPSEAYNIIRKSIEDGEWEKRKDAIMKARELIFTKYNLFAQVVKAIESGCAVYPKGHIWDETFLLKRKQTRYYPVAAMQDFYNHVKRFFASLGVLK